MDGDALAFVKEPTTEEWGEERGKRGGWREGETERGRGRRRSEWSLV